MKGFFLSLCLLGLLGLTTMAARAQSTVADFIKMAQDKEGNGDPSGAIQIFNAILKQYPKEFPEVYAYRADDRKEIDDNKGAIADYNMALTLDNDPKGPILNHDEIYKGRAEAKRYSGDVKGAVADYHLALKDHPDNSFTIADMAETELDYSQCAAANTDYSQAIALATVPEVLYFENRGAAHLCLGDVANSYSDYQAAVALDLKGDSKIFGQLYLDAWATGVKLGRKADADAALDSQLTATTNNHEDNDLDRDAAAVMLGHADISVIEKDAAAYTAKDTDNPGDIWTGYVNYYIGLKQMADGDNKAAIASFQKLLAAKHHLSGTEVQARGWITVLGGAKPK